MNERIREIYKEVRGILHMSDNFMEEWEFKFAELIVRECAYIPIDMWDKAELNADVAVKIEDRIKQHFGIDE